MKGKVAIAFGVLAGAILLVFLLPTSPDHARINPPETKTSGQPEAVVAAGVRAGAPAEPTAPAPVVAEEAPAAIEERLALSAVRLSLWSKLEAYWWAPAPRMSEEDYQKARGLYLRHLDNFARIKTARFWVDGYEVQLDGSLSPAYSYEVVYAWPKYRVERTSHQSTKSSRSFLHVCDGKSWYERRGDGEVSRGNAGQACGFMWNEEMALVQYDHHPRLNSFTHYEIDDGTTGYSRLWNENGDETRFDTATNLLVENVVDGYRVEYTYQKTGDYWFHRETRGGGFCDIFSNVVINEPVDESMFDVDKPFQP
ncbi:MAG: hypothetical protein NTZ09_13210 [Candidatus Hydrogenedentes bacterium]|nr:hypothetical protein [Candidatus Hydrogenedentota bacterium]